MLNKFAGVMLVLMLPLAASAAEYQTVQRPRQECWTEQVPVQAYGQNYGGAIIGGFAGGVLGNQLGGGNGRTVATAVGAMTGAIVGDRMTPQVGTGYQTVQQCRTVYDQVQVPVYREPARVITQPVQVVEQPVFYVQQAQPYYQEYQYRGWHRHRHHRRHHFDDDD